MFGLGLGADDYIMKPFGIGALRARINAHLRRENREKRNILYMDPVRFNLSGKELYAREDKVPLTKSEYEICEFLARHRGQVFSKENIYEGVFGLDGESDSSAITEHVKNIRAKLGRYGLEAIETIWGSDINGSCKTTQSRAAAHLFLHYLLLLSLGTVLLLGVLLGAFTLAFARGRCCLPTMTRRKLPSSSSSWLRA